MQRIIIMRHGDAVFIGEDRVLSDLGTDEVTRSATLLCRDFRIDRIFSSAKTRACQTAAIVKDIAGLDGENEIIDELAPSGDIDYVCSYIEAIVKPNETFLLVSHLPLVAYLSEKMLCRSSIVPDFVTASAFVLQKEEGRYLPLAFYTPAGVKKY